jgi:hypothetical protein
MKTQALIQTMVVTILGLTGIARAESTVEIVPRSQVDFQPLNPLRGAASPQAGMLWGDIKADVPSGFIVRFRDGFASPPHIHNITYRAVVISGLAHNDDPDAARMWMQPGSFWTQPAGENHITAAKGDDVVAFLDILEGPYLVKPALEEFDNGERPINIDARNVMWLDAADAPWIAASTGGAQMAFLWGQPRDGELNGTFVKLPAGFSGEIGGDGDTLRAVVIAGTAGYTGAEGTTELAPGSYFGSENDETHAITCGDGGDCTLYIHSIGNYTLTPF